MTGGGSTFILLEFVFDSQVFWVIDYISDTDLWFGLDSGGLNFNLFDFLFEFRFGLISLLELTLTEFKLAFKFLDFSLSERILEIRWNFYIN